MTNDIGIRSVCMLPVYINIKVLILIYNVVEDRKC